MQGDLPDVHGLRASQPLPGGGARGQTWGGSLVGLLTAAQVGTVHMVVGSVRVAVAVQQLCRFGLRAAAGVHALHGRIHLVHQLLQVHIII